MLIFRLLRFVGYLLDWLELKIVCAYPSTEEWVGEILEPKFAVVAEYEHGCVGSAVDTAEVVAWGDVKRWDGHYLCALYQADILDVTWIFWSVVPYLAVLSLGADACDGDDVAAIGAKAGADVDEWEWDHIRMKDEE